MKKNYTINIPVGTFWKVLVPLFFVLIFVAGIAGILIVDKVVMPRLPNMSNKGVVTVPSIVNLSKDEAKEKLYDVGLRLQIQDKEYSDSLADDVVMIQTPAGGKEVKKGRHVFAVLSNGPEVAEVPTVYKRNERQARNVFRKAGFNNAKFFKVFSNGSLETVVGSNPKGGTLISREYPVEVYISKGPKPTHVTVPNLIGEALSSAKQLIRESGIRLGRINYKNSTERAPGTILSQSLSPGVRSSIDSRINIVVAAKK